MTSFDGYVVIREVPLPPGVHGAIRLDPDGIANIYINSRDPEEERRKTLRHEIKHYELKHIGSGKPLSMMEAEADEAV